MLTRRQDARGSGLFTDEHSDGDLPTDGSTHQFLDLFLNKEKLYTNKSKVQREGLHPSILKWSPRVLDPVLGTRTRKKDTGVGNISSFGIEDGSQGLEKKQGIRFTLLKSEKEMQTGLGNCAGFVTSGALKCYIYRASEPWVCGHFSRSKSKLI